MAILPTNERVHQLGHILNRIRGQLLGVGLLEEAESIRVAARECWRVGRLLERKPATDGILRDYLHKHPDVEDLDDDALDAEVERLFAA